MSSCIVACHATTTDAAPRADGSTALVATADGGSPTRDLVPIAPPKAVAVKTADASAEAAAPPVAPPPRGLVASVCGARHPCTVLFVRDIGLDRRHRPMLLATVDRGRAPAGEGDAPGFNAAAPAEGDDADDTGLFSSDTEDVTSPTSPCHRYEHWLAVHAGARWTSQLLRASCNDGYGAAGVGEDRIRVEEGGVRVEHSGGSNWRWTEVQTIALDPLHVRLLEWQGTFAFGGHHEHGSWDWDLFRGAVEWSGPDCGATGEPPDDDFDDGGGAIEYRYDAIPEVALDDAFTSGGWRTTVLGSCAASIDSGGSAGFVVFGEPGAADDAAMRVVASTEPALYVEIRDDHWTGPSANWVADDHLELWTSEEDQSYMDACLTGGASPPKQWGVRVADGRVFSGSGHPDAGVLQVARAAAPGVVRLRVALPDKTKGVTVVYSDGDDGAHQKRLIATSEVRFGVTETLGKLYPIAATEASCAVRAGRLDARLAPPRRTRDQPVVGKDDD